MSGLLEPGTDFEAPVSIEKEYTPKLFNNNRSLKSKENIFKLKFNRDLKRKLKKYKLRRDGQEDPEVLDVSQILVTTLKIKSPSNKVDANDLNDFDNLRPKNYLFKMGRKKQVVKKKNGATDENEMVIKEELKKNKISSSSPDVSKGTYGEGILDVVDKKPSDITKDKNQKNAFTLMMDSRNKSIGSNSPGKEKVVDEHELVETIERKNIKAKRNILLQKMAEAKGSLKNKEVEEYQEKLIKKKMDKRAERLKNMIKSNDKPVRKEEKKPTPKEETVAIMSNNRIEDTLLSSPKSQLKLVNIFNDPAKNLNISIVKKKSITKEEQEFLNKLSPSLKKKENMLCYFKKIDKEQNGLLDDFDDNNATIKVKLKSKRKDKINKKKLSLNKGTENNDENSNSKKETNNTEAHFNKISDENQDSRMIKDQIEVSQKKKQKKVLKSDVEVKLLETDVSTEPCELDIMRPRRNVKRPAKYVDDMQISSSDEELHIFTPKKKKHVDQKNKCVDDEVTIIDDEKKPRKTLKSEARRETNVSDSKKEKKTAIIQTQPKKPTKLAPIFSAKPQFDAAALEAKQKFLSSGVPDILKKHHEKQANKIVGVNHFHTVVHIQQPTNIVPKTDKLETIYSHGDQSDEEIDVTTCKQYFFKSILKLDLKSEGPILTNVKNDTQIMLRNLKQLYPRFPVYRTYRLLRDKNRGEFKDCSFLDLDNSIEAMNDVIDITNESPDRLSWTDKYKALSSKQIIGNFESIKELKKWLVTWTENDCKQKKNNNANSDSSDFYLSDTDSKDSMKSTNNLLVLTGPVGSGKTSLVYAVAAELAIKVLEVNASSKRTGKIMLQDLQEATQSHKVNRTKSSQEMSQKSQEITQSEKPKVKKRGRPKKAISITSNKSEPMPKIEVLSQPGSQDSVRTCMSLILIDDADIVFDQDDGFCPAIVQLVHCSKRPVILITSSLSCPHLQRFLQCAKIIHTRPLFPRMLGTWIDIMCLADSRICWPGLGEKCLDYFKGDIRKTINFLQFQTIQDSVTEEEGASQNPDDYKVNMEDENSNMSWSDREGVEVNARKKDTMDADIWQYFIREEASLLSFKHPLNVFKVWWNVPRLLILSVDYNVQEENGRAASQLQTTAMSNVADMISIADYFCRPTKYTESDLVSAPWSNFENHSVSELECLDKYDRNHEIANEISHSLLTGGIAKSQTDLQSESRTDLEFPEMATRRKKDRIADRHSKLTSFLSPSAILDRRALALDYWSGCRTICRVEKTRTDSNSKRNNRFCHYLKSANILCKSDSFDNLANSLYCEEEY